MAHHEVTPEEIAMLEEMVKKAKAAAEVIATYDQEKVDRLARAICAALYPLKVWGPICDEAVDETRLGDKVTKRNKRNKLKLILRDCLRQKSVGIIEEIPEKGLVKYAKPVGVIATLVPTTNPCVTPAGQAIYAVKARDVLICSPHPRAKKITTKTVNIIRDVLAREGAPADIVQVIEEPSITLTQELMKMVDLVIATGGRPMVRAAYSSGVPAYGSGAGNSTVIVDNTANTKERAYEAATNTRISKCSDFGSGCSCDGNLIVHEDVYDDFVEGLVKEGAYIPTWEQAEAIKKVMWDETGHRLPDTVAISPQAIAKAAGFEIPADRKFIAVPNNGQKEGFTIRTAEDIKKCIGKQHFFSTEKLTTLLTLFKYGGEFQTALDIMLEIFDKAGGKGHSCGLYSFDDDHIHRLGMCAPVSRCMIRQPNNRGNAGSSTNGMPPTNSMGCGTWGGNIVSENITLKHYMNTTWVARPIPEDMPSLQALFGEFYEEGMDEE